MTYELTKGDRFNLNPPPDITSRVNEVLNKRYKQVQDELSKLKSFLRSIGRNPYNLSVSHSLKFSK